MAHPVVLLILERTATPCVAESKDYDQDDYSEGDL